LLFVFSNVEITQAKEIAGHLIIIGGAEDKHNERQILRRFLALAGGPDASILIIPVASDFPEIAAHIYTTLFTTLGARKVSALHAVTRSEVLEADPEELLGDVTGVFMTGGDQLRLATILGGTGFSALLGDKVRNGMVLAGTSAGAAGMSNSMIVRGDPGVEPTADTIRISPGLGILRNIVIDQHFTQRARLTRLITAVSYNPRNLGIGIDEDTAIIITNTGILEVIGAGTVTIVDGSQIGYSNLPEVPPSKPFTVCDIRLHILNSHLRYDVNARKVILHHNGDERSETGGE
jgi:cyanophycinase